jgi:hypothetical protein
MQELARVFGPVESKTTTGNVLTLPSTVSKDQASHAVGEMDLDAIMHDIGAITARHIADELGKLALRAADYANLPDLDRIIAIKLAKELEHVPESFAKALIEFMKLRG